jgi:hypothetical protein
VIAGNNKPARVRPVLDLYSHTGAGRIDAPPSPCPLPPL